MKCQLQRQKCEQNVFLCIILIKHSYRIGKKWHFAGCAFPR